MPNLGGVAFFEGLIVTIKRDHTATTLRRLAELDAALAGDGITARDAAERWGLSTKTFRRDIATLRSLGADIPEGDQLSGKAHTYRYADRRRRVFSKWVSEFDFK